MASALLGFFKRLPAEVILAFLELLLMKDVLSLKDATYNVMSVFRKRIDPSEYLQLYYESTASKFAYRRQVPAVIQERAGSAVRKYIQRGFQFKRVTGNEWTHRSSFDQDACFIELSNGSHYPPPRKTLCADGALGPEFATFSEHPSARTTPQHSRDQQKDEVCRFNAKPRFRIIDAVDRHGISKENITYLNRHGYFTRAPFAKYMPEFDVLFEPTRRLQPVELFKHPFIEVVGAGFDKPASLYELGGRRLYLSCEGSGEVGYRTKVSINKEVCVQIM
ncbi:hypothetical protein BKA56DRAFT_623974 [Ilyonectria sp. MPI-CAGE-AT-0026]|nr:hypothetical protein BKA56DRAFT_623974 [Ilyonectria sp. MPI-CAGE-AT-0026]